ncbi:MAG: type IX secretion system membrane protein PorP/SprF [Crocinitomicaceae bacterium]
MKFLVTIISISTCLFSMAQQDMFWNNYSNHNPAMSGFQYEQHGAVSYSDYFKTEPSGRTNRLIANYNVRLAEKHGLGLNYSGNYDINNYETYLLNYNYQLNLANAGKLSFGIGAGINRRSQNRNYVSPNQITPIQVEKNIQLNIGVAHKWKGLTSGISMHNSTLLMDDLIGEYFAMYRPGFTVHSGYQFRLSDQVKLTPRAILQARNGYSGGFFSGDLTVTLFDKLSIGMMYSLDNREHIGVHIGYDVQDRFRLSYSYNSRTSGTSNNPSYLQQGQHQFTLGFLLK